MPRTTRKARRWLSRERPFADNGNGQHHGPAPTAENPPRRSRRSLWLIALLCLVGSFAVVFVVTRMLVATTPQELVGTWKVQQGPLKGATMQFRQNGTAVLSKGVPGDEDNYTVKVENKKIFLSGKDARTGKNDTFVQTIVSVNAEELVIRDEDRVTYRMVRVSK